MSQSDAREGSAVEEEQDYAGTVTGALLFSGGAWSMTSRVLPQLYALILSVVAARFLGPDGMGRQSFIAFVALSTTMMLSSGISTSLMRHVGETLGARRPSAVRALVGWAWGVAAAAALLGGGFLALIALSGAEPTAAWSLAAIGCSLGVLQSIPSAVLIGCQRWRHASIVGIVTGGMALPATIAVLAAGGGITGIFAVEAVVSAINLAWASVLASRTMDGLPGGSEPDPELRRRTIRYALGATLGVVLTFVVFRRSEFFFLDQFSTDAEIALYSIAFAATYAIALMSESLAGVVVPAFAALSGAEATERIRAGFGRALRLLLIVTVPVTAAVLAFGPELLRLVYGSEYEGTSAVLRVLAIGLPLLAVMNVSNALLVGLGRIRPQLVIGAGAAALNIALAIVLIPRLDAVGAGLANLGAQAGVAVATTVYSTSIVGAGSLAAMFDRHLGATTVASVVGGTAGWLLLAGLGGGALGLLLGATVGTILFASLAVRIKLLSSDDAAWIERAAESYSVAPGVNLVCRLIGEQSRMPAGG